MMKRLFAIALSAIMLMAMFAGCGAKSASSYDAGMNYAPSEERAEMEAPTASDYWDSPSAAKGENGIAQEKQKSDAKMIYTANINMETQDFDAADQALCTLVETMGGYFEQRSISDRSAGYTYGDYTVRIPAECFDQFCNQLGELCHVTYANSSAENISESYYDTAARLETAKIKLDRLQALLAKAENMEDIITLESAISETEYTIESLGGTLRHYDALVDYSTVYISLSEVYHLSDTETAPESFGGRIANAFKGGLREVGDFFEDLAVAFAYNWAFLLIAAAVIFGVVKLVRFAVRKKRAASAAKKEAKTAAETEKEK